MGASLGADQIWELTPPPLSEWGYLPFHLSLGKFGCWDLYPFFAMKCKLWDAFRGPPLTVPFFSWQAPREALAQTVLAEVPIQLVSYFKAQGWAPFKPLPPPAKGPAQAAQT